MIAQLMPSWMRKTGSLPSLASRSNWKTDKIGAPTGLIIALLVFSVLSAPFRRFDNLMLIAMEASLIGIVAVGQTLVLLIGGIDLSVGSVVALTGVIAASLMKGFSPFPPLPSYLALALGMLLGLTIGGLQGWLITNRNMPPFIVTLGTMIGLQGLTQAYTNASNSPPINALPDDFKWISDGQIGPIPAPALIMIAIYVLTWYLLRNTKFGRYCYAIGGNETAARLAGINVNRYKTYVYAISGLLAAVAGMILIARINGGSYTNGSGYELNTIAAAIIGGTSLSGGVGGVWGTLIGVLLMDTVNNGLTMCSVPPEWQQVVTGAIILLAVLIDVERRRRPKPAMTKVEVERPAPSKIHLHQILSGLAHSVEEQMGCAYCAVYLVDRDTDELVPQTLFKTGKPNETSENQLAPGRSRIVNEVKESGNPVSVMDVARSIDCGVVPMHSDIHSALAVPLRVQNRVVGIVEVQSVIPDGFSPTAANLLGSLGNPMAGVLEDAWLMESGWLVRQVRDSLRHLWDDLHLGRSPLADWILSVSDTPVKPTLGARGETVREVLLTSIESLRPSEIRDQSRSGRGHRILQLTYLEEHPVNSITGELNISRRQYFYDLKEALDTLSDTLVREHQAKLQAQPRKEPQKLRR